MTLQRGLSAAVAAVGLALGIAACGDDGAQRPAHRPISVIYVAGQPTGPWAARTEGLADGVKLAVAEANGLVGERALSTVVVPIEQRDGDQVSAAIGAGRILRDSRALAVLGTLTAPQTELTAPQLNGGELAFLQYGSGMRGLLAPELAGEPGRYQPSGKSLALRGVPSDDAVADAVRGISGTQRIDVVPVDTAFHAEAAQRLAEQTRAAAAARKKAIEDGSTGDDVPSSDPHDVFSIWTDDHTDAGRLGSRIAKALGGSAIVAPTKATGAQVLVIDPTQDGQATEAREAARRSKGLLVVIDAADREIPASAVAGHDGPVYRVRRTLDDPTTAAAQQIRAKERRLFGRDRGEAVIAGYRAARRILAVAADQPDKTIDRMDFATQLVADAPNDADLPVQDGQVQLGSVVVERLSGGRWVSAAS